MALMRARESVMSRFRPILAEYGLTEQQWRVLRALAAADKPLSVGELAEQTLLLGPSLSRMLASMERRALIDRTSARTDARRAQVTITRRGLELVTRIGPESEAAYGELESELGPDELETLHQLLDRVAAMS
ncbi:MAG: homoprotocatechuate degradation operon regulator HpaR [Acidimicrobiia bacterium]|nr:homoprotocatechuate degradation operon regulator HpaR [Acidimicrobiia bacterium]